MNKLILHVLNYPKHSIPLNYYVNYYRTSLQYGISCLKRLNFDRQQLEDRRRMAESANVDVLVWSNDRLIRWVQSIGLKVLDIQII